MLNKYFKICEAPNIFSYIFVSRKAFGFQKLTQNEAMEHP